MTFSSSPTWGGIFVFPETTAKTHSEILCKFTIDMLPDYVDKRFEM